MKKKDKFTQIRKLIREQLELINDISKIKIENILDNDYEEVLDIMSEEFDFLSREEVAEAIDDVNYSISLKAVNQENKIVGILLFENTDINSFLKRVGKPLHLNYSLDIFKNKKGINGTAFVINKKYRGSQLNRMFLSAARSIISGYDYVLSEVMEQLKTHNYWKHMGFKELGKFEMKDGYNSFLYFYSNKI